MPPAGKNRYSKTLAFDLIVHRLGCAGIAKGCVVQGDQALPVALRRELFPDQGNPVAAQLQVSVRVQQQSDSLGRGSRWDS